MPISNYTTKINSMHSIAEIQQILVNHNAEKIMTEYENKIPVGLTFQVNTAHGVVAFRMPANWQGVLSAMQKDPKVTKAAKNKEQAIKVAWRILRDWVEAQMAMVEAELATVDQVFFPYAMIQSGKTVYENFNTNNYLKLDK